MTDQEIFTKVARHLLAQGQRSERYLDDDGEPGCAYRGTDGLKCAVGCLIPDELYHQSIEGCTVAGDVVQSVLREAGIRAGYGERTDSLLYELQNIHDYYEPCSWEYYLKIVAKNFNLEMPA